MVTETEKFKKITPLQNKILQYIFKSRHIFKEKSQIFCFPLFHHFQIIANQISTSFEFKMFTTFEWKVILKQLL